MQADEEIAISEYNPEGTEWYREETERLRAIFPGARFEHFGSAAVPGIHAKPVADILAGLRLSGESALSDGCGAPRRSGNGKPVPPRPIHENTRLCITFPTLSGMT